MKRTLAIALLIAATSATSAFAGTKYIGEIAIDTDPFVSTLSRAEVQREFLASPKEVSAMTGQDSGSAYLAQHRAVSDKTRAEVRQEYVAAREEVRAMTGEDSGSAYLAQRRAPNGGTHLVGQAAVQE